MTALTIGGVRLEGPGLLLAPMEDVTERPFRTICKELGADIVYTEFVNADYLDGTDYVATDELTSGTVFKFDIELDDGTASGAQDIGARDGLGACATSAGVGESLEMKIIVDGGGTTILELNIESVTSGKEVT